MDKKGVKKAKGGLTQKQIQLALIDNFVNMQKALANLAIKFDYLSQNTEKLLKLIEISAVNFIEKQSGNKKSVQELEIEDKELVNKIDSLLDQNKTIAKGLTLVEEKLRHKLYGEHENQSLSFARNFPTHNNPNLKQISEAERARPKPLPKI